MAKKPKFPEEPITKPARGRPPPSAPPRRSGPARKLEEAEKKAKASEAPTMPPPPRHGPPSGLRARAKLHEKGHGAKVDEVVADLSKDPRVDVEEEEDDDEK